MATSIDFVRKCQPLHLPNRANTRNLLCKAEHPIYPQSNSLCLFKLFNNPYNNPTNCGTREIFYHQLVIRLTTPNSWLFMTSEPLKMEIHCFSKRYPISLQGTGVLHFKDHCTVNFEEFSLPTLISSEKRINISELFSYPDINMPTIPEIVFGQPTKILYHPSVRTRISDHESHNLDFINEDAKLRNLQHSIAIAEEESTLNLHAQRDHSWYSVFIVSFLVILTTVSVCLCYFKCRNRLVRKFMRNKKERAPTSPPSDTPTTSTYRNSAEPTSSHVASVPPPERNTTPSLSIAPKSTTSW